MELQVIGTFNPALLSEEIAAAFPRLIAISDGVRTALFRLSYREDVLRFQTAASIDEALLRQVIQAHDPVAKSKNERRAGRYAQLKPGIRTKLAEFTDEELGFLQEFFADLAGKE
jgi:hypothetical protein